MKKCTVLLLCLTLISAIFAPFIHAQSSTTQQKITTPQPSRAIHVVYDDSAGMINESGISRTGKYVDHWAQAKYAMEVFAVMLEEKDTMRIYYMSDFDMKHNGKLDHPPKITIEGKEKPAQSRVENIHKTVSEAWNTPYDTVAKAYDDLKKTTADKKWLVLMTDGEYNQFDGNHKTIDGIPFELENPISNQREDNPAVFKIVEKRVNDNFRQYIKESDVNIIILAMGDDVKTNFKEVRDRIFLKNAIDSNQILGKITEICNQIFNRNRYPDKIVNMREFKFDLPMTELLVFVQGPNVEIKSIKGDRAYPPNETTDVRNSTVAATSYPFNDDPKIKIPKLTGVLARFRDIPKGEYSLEYTGVADDVEIYIKPDVNFQIKMYKPDNTEIPVNIDRKGQKVFDDIIEGNYRIEFGVLDENGNFFKPKILTDIKYTVKVNGKEIQINSGDTVNLTQGKTEVYVQARYLDITADDTLTGNISTPLSFWETLGVWVHDHWVLLTRLFFILLALLLIWFLWGTKKRFPKKYMARRPVITIKSGGYENPDNRLNGKFIISKKTRIWPLCAEEGRISFAPADLMLPNFKVKAKDKSNMILMNSNVFTPGKLSISGVTLRIDNSPVTEDKMEISCMATITTTVRGSHGSRETTYTCYLEKQ